MVLSKYSCRGVLIPRNIRKIKLYFSKYNYRNMLLLNINILKVISRSEYSAPKKVQPTKYLQDMSESYDHNQQKIYSQQSSYIWCTTSHIWHVCMIYNIICNNLIILNIWYIKYDILYDIIIIQHLCEIWHIKYHIIRVMWYKIVYMIRYRVDMINDIWYMICDL